MLKVAVVLNLRLKWVLRGRRLFLLDIQLASSFTKRQSQTGGS